MALYFVGLFIRIVCTPFSSVTTSSLYLFSVLAAEVSAGAAAFDSSSVVPNCTEKN